MIYIVYFLSGLLGYILTNVAYDYKYPTRKVAVWFQILSFIAFIVLGWWGLAKGIIEIVSLTKSAKYLQYL
ncbi:hypothetical protein HY967_02325 [Candidatus Jorgensenbacteria bacterium]|nr:hypothetical protein [Candidatus Jorgensenbacteria bacterium]